MLRTPAIPAAFMLTALAASILPAQSIVKTSERSVRARATNKIMPAYPSTSLRAKAEGVAVALIEANPAGTVETVRVLQAPDDAIAAAVRDAVKQWTVPELKVAGSAQHYVTQARLTFYFQIAGGRGRVLSPDQVPGNSDVFTPPAAAAAVPARGAGTPSLSSGEVRQKRPAIKEIGPPELDRLRAGADPWLLLDVRERTEFARGQTKAAVNVPFEELAVRARAEFGAASTTIVIDCSYADPALCRQAGRVLQDRSFERIFLFLP